MNFFISDLEKERQDILFFNPKCPERAYLFPLLAVSGFASLLAVMSHHDLYF